MRETADADSPFVTAFDLTVISSTNRLTIPRTTPQTVFINMAGPAKQWRGTIPAGTALTNDEGSPASLTSFQVADDFTVTDSSIVGVNSESPYQPIAVENTKFAIPRPEPIFWFVTGPVMVVPADVLPAAPYLAWVKFSDIGTAINDNFDEVPGVKNVRQSERVRTFTVDSFVSADWHEGDYIETQGEYYVIQSRRVLSAHEIEFDATSKPRFRLIEPPEAANA